MHHTNHWQPANKLSHLSHVSSILQVIWRESWFVNGALTWILWCWKCHKLALNPPPTLTEPAGATCCMSWRRKPKSSTAPSTAMSWNGWTEMMVIFLDKFLVDILLTSRRLWVVGNSKDGWMRMIYHANSLWKHSMESMTEVTLYLFRQLAFQGEDQFSITPKPQPLPFQWSQPSSINGCKWSSVASAFPAQALEFACWLHCVSHPFLSFTVSFDTFWLCAQALKESGMIQMSWRVAYAKESNAACLVKFCTFHFAAFDETFLEQNKFSILFCLLLHRILICDHAVQEISPRILAYDCETEGCPFWTMSCKGKKR